MKLLKTWEKYFVQDVLKVFLPFLALLYGLYILIDYTGHTGDFARLNYGIPQIAFYYLCHFIKRLEILVPLALMLATLRTLCQANVNNELVALLASGINLKRLSRPFFLIALASTLLIYANYQFALPNANHALRWMRDYYNPKSASSAKHRQVNHVEMVDNSLLLYQHYDTVHDRLFDLYWIRGGDEIYRIKHLHPSDTSSKAEFVDHLRRGKNGAFEKVASYREIDIEELGMTEDVKSEALTSPDNKSLYQLWSQLPAYKPRLSRDEAELITNFYYMLVMPWLCVLVVLAPLPFCTQFTRHLNIFFRYGVAIIGFLAFFTIMNSTRILGEHQVIHPAWGVLVPFILFGSPSLFFFLRMR